MCAGMRLALRVPLQVDANPPQGVHVHVSNPTNAAIPLAYGRHQEGGRSSWFGQTHTAGWRNMPIRF